VTEATQLINDIRKTGAHSDGESRINARSEVVRLSGLSLRDELQNHREQYLETLRASPFASLDLHPDLLSPLCDDPSVGLLALASWPIAGNGGRESARLAVLAKRQTRLRMLPRPDWAVVFNGLRLLGNEVIGCDSRSDAMPFANAIAELLARQETDSILFENLTVGSSLHEALIEATSADRRIAMYCLVQPQPRWWIDFPNNPADYWKKFSKNSRKRFRSDARKFDHELLRFTTAEDVPRFLERAAKVSSASWQDKRLGEHLSDAPGARRGLEQLAKIGAFRSYVLEHNDRPVAYRIGRQWNGKYTSEKVGYDLGFRQDGVGTLLTFRVLEDLIAHDTPSVFDFDFGDGQHKRFFGNRQTSSAVVMLVRRTVKNSAIFGAHRLLSDTLIGVRSSRIYKRLRRSYRG
jgi:Acetyltransferase (GNAT) domain